MVNVLWVQGFRPRSCWFYTSWIRLIYWVGGRFWYYIYKNAVFLLKWVRKKLWPGKGRDQKISRATWDEQQCVQYHLQRVAVAVFMHSPSCGKRRRSISCRWAATRERRFPRESRRHGARPWRYVPHVTTSFKRLSQRLVTSQISSDRRPVRPLHASAEVYPLRAGPTDKKTHLPWNGKFNKPNLLLPGAAKDGEHARSSLSGFPLKSSNVTGCRRNSPSKDLALLNWT
jgi:hypothetical protein